MAGAFERPGVDHRDARFRAEVCPRSGRVSAHVGQAATLLGEIRAATERLVATVEGLGAEDLAAPSLLPGWTRAHVLTHVSRNADGARNLLLAVRSGQPVRMYASPATRTADIDAGVGRPAEVVIADAAESSRKFVIDAECMPEERWAVEIPFSSGSPEPPPLISGIRPLEMRLREIELHHVDLAAGYSFDQIPEPVLERLLADTVYRLGRQGVAVGRPFEPESPGWTVERIGSRSEIRGSRPDVLAWLSGRSTGAGLAAAEPLPPIPSLG